VFGGFAAAQTSENTTQITVEIHRKRERRACTTPSRYRHTLYPHHSTRRASEPALHPRTPHHSPRNASESAALRGDTPLDAVGGLDMVPRGTSRTSPQYLAAPAAPLQPPYCGMHCPVAVSRIEPKMSHTARQGADAATGSQRDSTDHAMPVSNDRCCDLDPSPPAI